MDLYLRKVIHRSLARYFWHFSKHNLEAASVGGLFSSPCQSCAPCAALAHGTLSLRIFPWMLDPVPRRYTVCSRLFLPRCHRPSPKEKWVGFPQLSRLKRLHAGGLSRLQIFRYVPASKFARPPDRPYRCEYSRRAAGAFTSEQNAVRYLPAHRIC